MKDIENLKITDFSISDENGQLFSIKQDLKLFRIYKDVSKLEKFTLIPEEVFPKSMLKRMKSTLPLISICEDKIEFIPYNNNTNSLYRTTLQKIINNEDEFLKEVEIDKLTESTLLNITASIQNHEESKNKITSKIQKEETIK